LSPRPSDSEEGAQERELLALLQAGHPQAQERLYKAYRRRLLVTAWHVLGFDDAEAEDAVQEAFIQALRALPRTQIHTSLYGWLNRICVLRCIDIIRGRRRSLAKDEADLELLTAEGASQRQQLDEQRQEGERRAAALRQTMLEMEEPCRSLLWQRDVEGLSYIDLAKRQSLALGTVMSRLSRCRENLKQKFLRREGEERP
jgi:RNA polymerase sigma factor (sigma-70 family)